MAQSLTNILKNWSFPCIWFLVAMKQYYMSWDVAQLYCGGALVSFCLLFTLAHSPAIFRDSTPAVVFVYGIIIGLCAFPRLIGETASIQGLIDILLFPSLFLFFYSKVSLGQLSFNSMILVAVVFIPFSIWNAFRWNELFLELASMSQQSNAGNFVTALLPFIFLFRNKLIRWAGLTAIGIALAISMKRSGAVLWSAFVLYEILFSNMEKKNIFKRLFILLLSTSALTITWINIKHSFFVERTFSRLAQMGEDGGSGRIELFFKGWEDLNHRDALSCLIGEGPIGSSEFLWGIRYAYHNDFVEILRSSGILGLSVFFIMLITLALKSYNLRKEGYNYSEIPFLCVLFFILSSAMFSPIVGFTFYTLPTVALMGASFAYCRNQHESRRIPYTKGLHVARR